MSLTSSIGNWFSKVGNRLKWSGVATATLGVIGRWAGALSTALWVPAPRLIGSGKLTTLIWGAAAGIGKILERSGDKIA